MTGALRLNGRTVSLILVEAAVVYGAIICAVYLRIGAEDAVFELTTNNGYWKAAVAGFFCLSAFYLFDLYDFLVLHDRRELVLRLVQALGLAWIALAFSFYMFPAVMLGRSISLIALPLALGLMVSWRVSMNWFLGNPDFGERIAIVMSENLAVDRIFGRKARVRRPPGFHFLRFVQFFYSRKAVEEVFKPMLADWRFEYYECLKEDRIWQARWTSVRWKIRFLFATGISQAIAFVKDFIPFGGARD